MSQLTDFYCTQFSEIDTQLPEMDMPSQETDIQFPEMDIQFPEMGIQFPEMDDQVSKMDIQLVEIQPNTNKYANGVLSPSSAQDREDIIATSPNGYNYHRRKRIRRIQKRYRQKKIYHRQINAITPQKVDNYATFSERLQGQYGEPGIGTPINSSKEENNELPDLYMFRDYYEHLNTDQRIILGKLTMLHEQDKLESLKDESDYENIRTTLEAEELVNACYTEEDITTTVSTTSTKTMKIKAHEHKRIEMEFPANTVIGLSLIHI